MIANMLEGMEHEEAARLAGLSRSAAYEWHNRYEEDGIEGLRDRPRPGRQPRVDAVTSARFKDMTVRGSFTLIRKSRHGSEPSSVAPGLAERADRPL
jgi:transposase